MNKYFLIGLMFCILLTASSSAFYEDFEDPCNVKATLQGTAYVEDGYLKGYDQRATLDGTYPPSVRIEMTFNLNGGTGWDGVRLGWAGNNAGTGMAGLGDGPVLTYAPDAYGNGYLSLDFSEGDEWTALWDAWNEIPPGNDNTADYRLVVEEVDDGSTVNFWIEEVADPSNSTPVRTVDLSAFPRYGDLIQVTAKSDFAGIDSVRVMGGALPVGTIDPGSISISEPSGSDTYVITLTEAIPAGADFRVYLDPNDLWDGGLKQATVTPAKAGDPNTDSTNHKLQSRAWQNVQKSLEGQVITPMREYAMSESNPARRVVLTTAAELSHLSINLAHGINRTLKQKLDNNPGQVGLVQSDDIKSLLATTDRVIDLMELTNQCKQSTTVTLPTNTIEQSIAPRLSNLD